jgi:hypothetical protein
VLVSGIVDCAKTARSGQIDSINLYFSRGLVTHSIAGKIAQPRTSPSSRGLGHRPFTAVTRVRIPLGARSTSFKEVKALR